MIGWWEARRRLRQRERALGPATQELAASKAALDGQLRRFSPVLLTGASFGLGLAAGRASRHRRRLPLPRLSALLLPHIDKAVALLLAWALRGSRAPFTPTPLQPPEETCHEQEHQ